MSQLDGRRVLITGASSGIGAATAEAITTAGGRVALLARRADALNALAQRLDGVAVPADVVDADATARAVHRAATQLGGLDAVVNAAGVLRTGAVAQMSPADMQLTFDVNVRGVLHVIRPAITHIEAASTADIVNISSMSGRRLKSAEMGVYAASKAAVHMLGEGLRLELGPKGIRVTTVAPGLVDTDLFGDEPAAARLHEKAAEVGLKPQDVARTVVEVLGAPAHVLHPEIVLLPLAQQ